MDEIEGPLDVHVEPWPVTFGFPFDSDRKHRGSNKSQHCSSPSRGRALEDEWASGTFVLSHLSILPPSTNLLPGECSIFFQENV